jgi:hypothetical protein
LNWCKGIAIAFHRRIDAISINSALTGVNSGFVISGPEILRISVFVVPPGIDDVIQFKWSKIAIVLNGNKIISKIFNFKKEIYFNRLMAFR